MSISLSKSEKSYIQSGLLASPPLRGDGRSLDAYRSVSLETGTAPLANGSATICIGRDPHDLGGGTEVVAACKLEPETVGIPHDGIDGGRIQCHVTCSPAAYPHLSSAAIDDLSDSFTNFLKQILSHPSLLPSNLTIIPRRKSWALHLDLLVLSDAGNIYDALFISAKACIWDTRVPRTQSIEFKQLADSKTNDDEMLDEVLQQQSGLDTRNLGTIATDFELTDSWDEGDPLVGRDIWPVCVTLHLLPPMHYLDASLVEEAATPFKLLLVFSVSPTLKTGVALQGIQLLGPGEADPSSLKSLIQSGQKYAKALNDALLLKLGEEDIRRAKRQLI